MHTGDRSSFGENGKINVLTVNMIRMAVNIMEKKGLMAVVIR